jgi:hypothetical protein
MPYIKTAARKGINDLKVSEFTPNNAGELQWVIAEFIHAYLMEKGLSYQNCNDMMGALAGAQLEFYREVVAPYENIKKQENGPVYMHISEYQASKDFLTTVKY